jgi:predicted Rossmann-fold nucleotide-binding protein
MVSGGGPGAMEATHLGAWMAGRSEEETDHAISILKEAPSFNDKRWLNTALQVMLEFPQEQYVSLGVPTWLYGHEPATPFATHIAKYFDNSIREDSILSIAKGGVIYSPGSAGTMQEIFQEAVQNHYLSFGYASPMIFMGSSYWTKEMPVWPFMQHLIDKGKYKNLLLTLTDSMDEIIQTIVEFRNA